MTSGVVRHAPQAIYDLADIELYTESNWGLKQADKYMADLEECARKLVRNPLLGRSCAWIRPGLRRFEKAQHVIFYRQKPYGILISRVLHQSMAPHWHEFEEEEPV